ncbi:hypothetical protein [Porphyromonas cangingivalis]|uniref:hypothetical protein n=1 Tax=Porphyromonas cangingivalis TaxID=36874 RepID=UPI0004716E19|nr:hypothetical protein [Porphyromonas cangingivalis]
MRLLHNTEKILPPEVLETLIDRLLEVLPLHRIILYGAPAGRKTLSVKSLHEKVIVWGSQKPKG